ncbi:hypothetical protein Bbelb_220350 [Branchiostoma belcheri]|nr:hypothetical protein Bbelb_220350 [Branchiostoma belcheri]
MNSTGEDPSSEADGRSPHVCHNRTSDNKANGDSASAANTGGRLGSYKIRQVASVVLLVIAVAVAAAALLSTGVFFFMYLTASTENKESPTPQETTTSQAYRPLTLLDNATDERPERMSTRQEIAATLPELSTTPALTELTPALQEMAFTLAYPALTLLDNATELPEMTSTRPEIEATLPELSTTPALQEMAPTLAYPALTLLDNATELPEMTSTLPEIAATLPELPTTPALTELTPALQEMASTLAYPALTLLDNATDERPEMMSTRQEIAATLPEQSTLLAPSQVTPEETTPTQALPLTTLPDITTELPEIASTKPEQSTTLSGMAATDTTDTSTTERVIQVTERDLTTTEETQKHFGGHLFVAYHMTGKGQSSVLNGLVPRCKNGYKLLAGTCIKLVSNGMSHGQAKLACMKEGAILAMPKTEELDAELSDLVRREGGNKEHWIGMEEKDGNWYWVDGSRVDKNGYKPKSSGWLSPKPVSRGYPMWDDDTCFKWKWFICQRPPGY